MRGCALTHRDWLLATRRREILCQQFCRIFNEFDVILCPPMPTLAFPHDHSVDHEHQRIEIDGLSFPYKDQFVWASIATLFGLPATVQPIDHSEDGLPIGIQIIGNYLEDLTTIEFAKLIEREFGGFVPPKAMTVL